MDNPTIEYYEGINKISITILEEWFRNFFDRNNFYLLTKPKVLVSGIVDEIKYTIQVCIDNSLKPYLMFCKNEICLEKHYIEENYSNVDKVFIELLIRLKKLLRFENIID